MSESENRSENYATTLLLWTQTRAIYTNSVGELHDANEVLKQSTAALDVSLTKARAILDMVRSVPPGFNYNALSAFTLLVRNGVCPMDVPATDPFVAECSGLSFGLCGLRVGWGVLPIALIAWSLTLIIIVMVYAFGKSKHITDTRQQFQALKN